MIPTTSANAASPTISGKLLFHVIVDDFHRTFSIDGPGGPNGVRLHYEMRQVARAEKKKLRDFDLRADSHSFHPSCSSCRASWDDLLHHVSCKVGAMRGDRIAMPLTM